MGPEASPFENGIRCNDDPGRLQRKGAGAYDGGADRRLAVDPVMNDDAGLGIDDQVVPERRQPCVVGS
jgi:hypothetical protein